MFGTAADAEVGGEILAMPVTAPALASRSAPVLTRTRAKGIVMNPPLAGRKQNNRTQ